MSDILLKLENALQSEETLGDDLEILKLILSEITEKGLGEVVGENEGNLLKILHTLESEVLVIWDEMEEKSEELVQILSLCKKYVNAIKSLIPDTDEYKDRIRKEAAEITKERLREQKQFEKNKFALLKLFYLAGILRGRKSNSLEPEDFNDKGIEYFEDFQFHNLGLKSLSEFKDIKSYEELLHRLTPIFERMEIDEQLQGSPMPMHVFKDHVNITETEIYNRFKREPGLKRAGKFNSKYELVNLIIRNADRLFNEASNAYADIKRRNFFNQDTEKVFIYSIETKSKNTIGLSYVFTKNDEGSKIEVEECKDAQLVGAWKINNAKKLTFSIIISGYTISK